MSGERGSSVAASGCAGGFTLLETLVATTIGVLLLTLVTGAFMHLKRLVERNQALVSLHETASHVHHLVSVDAQAALPIAKLACTADPGPDGAWMTNDEVLTMTWMASVSSPQQMNYGFERELKGDMLWCRLKWTGGGRDANGKPLRSSLQFARNTGFRSAYGSPNTYYTNSLLRRDRRRDVDDNDFRFIPGLTNAKYLSLGMPGDSQDLEAQLLDLNSERYSIRAVEMALVDRGGWRTLISHANGITRYDAAGVSQAWPGGNTWECGTQYGVDGVFLDARSHTAVGSTRTVADTRPVLLQLRFVIEESPWTEDILTVPMSFSFPTGTELSTP